MKARPGDPRCWDDEPGCNCGGYHPDVAVTPPPGPVITAAWPGDESIELMKERLVEQGRAQSEVAAALGISEKHLSMIFCDRSDPSFALARRMWLEIMS